MIALLKSFSPEAKQQAASLKYGWRSGLEKKIGDELRDQNIPFVFEALSVEYAVQEMRRYTPDFVLLGNGIIVETKGRFVTADRKKHKLVKQQHPDLDIRFLFSRAKDRIGKKSKTTYAMWCESNGFKWAEKSIPFAWLIEKPNIKSLRAIDLLSRR